MLAKLILFGCVLLHQGLNGDFISFGGGDPNVTHLTPNASITRTTFLYQQEINILFTAYQRPVNTTHKETLKVFTGITTIDSTNRCIAFGCSFDLWGQVPIQNPQETGNGGCDALWGKECSNYIRAKLLESSFSNINNGSCGIPNPDISLKPPPGCPPTNKSSYSITNTAFLRNGTFMQDTMSPTMNLSKPWAYYQSDPSVDGDYDKLMKNFVFIYFVGRDYTSNNIDTAISCMSVFNKTNEGTNGFQLIRPENFLFITSLIIIFFGIRI